MNKKLFFACSLFIAMMFGACSQSDLSNEKIDEGATSTMVLQLDFEGVDNVGARAAQSTAIPATSWTNISQVQFFLYETGSKTIRFSAIESPNTSPVSTFTYPDIPVGTYKLIAVANAKSSTDVITTSIIGNSPSEDVVWDMWNVRQKNAANLVMKHQPGTFPVFTNTAMAAANNKAYNEPSEIFMGETDVIVAAGGTVTAPVSLRREVSLMRIRINPKEGDLGVENNTSVEYDNDASISIYCLPEKMGILAGNEGGVSATSNKKDIISIHGATTFKTANPATGSGYSSTNIINGNFTMWRDVMVFPNNGGRANNGVVATARADAARQYFIVISARGKAGHVLADGSELSAPATVYWTGVIKENFVPNQIREVNLTLRTGGTTTLPTEPAQYGDMEIKVSTPVDWNANIVDSSVIM